MPGPRPAVRRETDGQAVVIGELEVERQEHHARDVQGRADVAAFGFPDGEVGADGGEDADLLARSLPFR